MLTIDQLKQKWSEAQATSTNTGSYDPAGFEKIVRSRVKKHTNIAMQYFWASFALQIIVYALLSHVMVRYWQDSDIVLSGFAGVVLFLPFTIILMKKFKGIAVARPDRQPSGIASETSLYGYISKRRDLLYSFYRFKTWYELILIPLASVIGVFIVFRLYIPGGVQQHWTGANVTLVITLISCALAIRSENRKNFREPLDQFDKILAEFRTEK